MQTIGHHCLTPAYWDQVVAENGRTRSLDAWRDYMSRVYRGLLERWIPSPQSGGGLKTDLFEEALSPYNVLPYMGPGSVGIDCSLEAVMAAKRRLQSLGNGSLCIVCDLRHLPIRCGAIRYVLSGSSLDHFLCEEDIARSLAELYRVLAPGGAAVITLDNPHNPAVWLRNRLPFDWLHRTGLVPYFVGVATTRTRTCQMLRAQGFEVRSVSAVVHAPRVFCIWLIALIEQLGWSSFSTAIARVLETFEALERWPTRFFTGHYVAYQVMKPDGRQPMDVGEAGWPAANIHR
jgi:SAM-dependent methyltransferase